ncbi:hypothetical protein B0T19DRAFT_18086 [Cercophora scortea]|uniref:Uncharacterized protein n=1 Tax=Cercophora scortea TaxID=314031 RepID=A0AAE0J3C4_9PEZI|nr:hypothetical protein B0T19DRAFT_18086 [Cercophora scortea]
MAGLRKMLASILVAAAMSSAAALPHPLPLSTPTDVVKSVPAFNVSNFAAAALVLSHRDYFRFDVEFCSEHDTVHCEVLGTTLTETLASIPQTFCEDSSTGVSFKWTENSDGSADLVIIRDLSSEDADIVERGVYHIPKNATPMMGTNQFQHQVYVGPPSFLVPARRFYLSHRVQGVDGED